MKFNQLNIAPEIIKSVDQLGYKKLTDIQYKAIPAILDGQDVLAIAQTGTGKTAAYSIPLVEIINKIKKSAKEKSIKGLVLAPTHELAQQIDFQIKTIAKFSRVKSTCIIGGVEQEDQKLQIANGTDIVVATPGRLFDLISQGTIDLSKLRVLVLDEADHMLDLGFIDDIRDLQNKIPKRRQTLFFSATISKEIKKIAYSIVNNAIRIQISPKNPVSKNVTHAVAHIEMDHKRHFLERMIKHYPDKKMMVFVRTKVRAERVQAAMLRVDINCLVLHGDMDQKVRNKTLADVKNNESTVLVATDVSARGIDIPHIDWVINYDLPDEAQTYIHRVGRTGRGVQKGNAISFCSNEEQPKLEDIELLLKKPLDVIEIGKFNYEEIVANSEEKPGDWKSLLQKDAEVVKRVKKKGKRKK